MEFPYIYSEWRESTSDFQPATPFGSPGHKVGQATATAPKVQDTKVPWSRGTGPKWRGDLVTYG